MTTTALLLISTGCAHCPQVLEALSSLLKQGQLARLEVINIAVDTASATALGVRSVPWMRIGDFELEGLHSETELLEWVQRANRGEGYGAYFSELLETGQLDRVLDLVERRPEKLPDLIELLAPADTPMAVRIGIGAVVEEFAGSPTLEAAIQPLRDLIEAEDPRTRADACYYLALTGDEQARAKIKPLLEDASQEVREIARESLAQLARD